MVILLSESRLPLHCQERQGGVSVGIKCPMFSNAVTNLIHRRGRGWCCPKNLSRRSKEVWVALRVQTVEPREKGKARGCERAWTCLEAPSTVHEPAASPSFGSRLGMQNLRLFPRLTDRNCILIGCPGNPHAHWNVRSVGGQSWQFWVKNLHAFSRLFPNGSQCSV